MYGNLRSLKQKDLRHFDIYFKEENLIYVYNNTLPRGEIYITIFPTVGGNKPYNIKIPKTFIPFNLTALADKDDLKHSRDIRKLYNSKHIVLVKPVEAEKILNTQESKDELIRLNMDMTLEEDAPESNLIEDPNNKVIKENVLTLVERKETDDINFKQLKSELRLIENELTEIDLKYVVEKFPDSVLISNFAQHWMEE